MVLFTGLTGTSGSALVELLSEKNYKERFRVLVRKTSNLTCLKKSGLNYEINYGDLGDKASLVSAMRGCETVFHIAAKYKLKEIVDAIIDVKTVKNCILVSSTSIYSKYRKTGYLQDDEIIVKDKLNKNNIAWTIIRPTMIFGTLKDSNLSVFIKMIDRFRIFPIVKGGKALLQPINRRDLANGYYTLLCNIDSCRNEEFIISGEKPVQLKTVLKQISHFLGKKTLFINIPFWVAKFCVNMAYVLTLRKIDYREKLFRLTEDRAFTHDKIKKRFGFSPTSFEIRLQELVVEYKLNKERKK